MASNLDFKVTPISRANLIRSTNPHQSPALSCLSRSVDHQSRCSESGEMILGLQLGEDDEYVVASDASFVGNSVNCKSSQGYAMKLFEGLVEWRANE